MIEANRNHALHSTGRRRWQRERWNGRQRHAMDGDGRKAPCLRCVCCVNLNLKKTVTRPHGSMPSQAPACMRVRSLALRNERASVLHTKLCRFSWSSPSSSQPLTITVIHTAKKLLFRQQGFVSCWLGIRSS